METLLPVKKETSRHRFISMLFSKLETYPYVLLKYTSESIQQISDLSDIDILFSKEHWAAFKNELLEDSSVAQFKEKSLNHVLHLFFYFKDGSFLQVDLMDQLIRKSLVYLDKAAFIKAAKKNKEGLQVPSDFNFLEHVVLFNFLNHAAVPTKYIHFLKTKEKALCKQFNQKYNTEITSLDAFEKFDTLLYAKLKKQVASLAQNGWLKRLGNSLLYFQDIWTNIKTGKGQLLTFSGVDGAGKSTILHDIKLQLEGKYRQQIVVIRHRPSVLPILSAYKYGKRQAEQRSASRLPRQGANKSKIGSLLRFAYYYTDYLFGQFYVFTKYTLQGTTVLYDRYYFDFIADAKRSNILIDKNLAKWLYRFVFKADLNVFLYAPAEVILKRKQELDANQIEELTSAYLALFQSFSSDKSKIVYLPIENIDRTKTVEIILNHYKNIVK